MKKRSNQLLLALTMASATTTTEGSRLRAAAAGRVRQSLARARSLQGPGKAFRFARAGAVIPAGYRPPHRKPAVVHLCGKFLRTGRCPRRSAAGASRCMRRHDADKVAVCTRW